MSVNGQKIIEAKKAQEQMARERRLALEAEERVKRIADFEIQTTKKIETKVAAKRFNDLNRQRESGLVERRRALAELYNAELAGWRNEVMAKVETVEERKARIMERAYALRDARETSRKQYISECYDRQWRQACDDARTLDSKAMSMWVGKERQRMMIENEEKLAKEKQDHAKWVEDWNKQLAEIDAKEDGKGNFKKQMEMETASEVMDQMRRNHELKLTLREQKHAEDMAEIAECRAAIATEEAKDMDRIQFMREQARQTRMYNEANSGTADEKARLEKEHDAILLAYALRKENEAKAAEQKKKDDAMAAAQNFRKYLELQMIRDAEDTGAIDAMRDAEAMKVWKAREEALNAREEARKNLMKSVVADREQQLAMKRAAVEQERLDEIEYAKTFIADAKQGIQREAGEADARRAVNEENQKWLNEQIEQRRLIREKERQDVYLADKEMGRIERLHKQKLQEQAGSVRLHYGKKANNMGWS